MDMVTTERKISNSSTPEQQDSQVESQQTTEDRLRRGGHTEEDRGRTNPEESWDYELNRIENFKFSFRDYGRRVTISLDSEGRQRRGRENDKINLLQSLLPDRFSRNQNRIEVSEELDRRLDEYIGQRNKVSSTYRELILARRRRRDVEEELVRRGLEDEEELLRQAKERLKKALLDEYLRKRSKELKEEIKHKSKGQLISDILHILLNSGEYSEEDEEKLRARLREYKVSKLRDILRKLMLKSNAESYIVNVLFAQAEAIERDHMFANAREAQGRIGRMMRRIGDVFNSIYNRLDRITGSRVVSMMIFSALVGGMIASITAGFLPIGATGIGVVMARASAGSGLSAAFSSFFDRLFIRRFSEQREQIRSQYRRDVREDVSIDNMDNLSYESEIYNILRKIDQRANEMMNELIPLDTREGRRRLWLGLLAGVLGGSAARFGFGYFGVGMPEGVDGLRGGVKAVTFGMVDIGDDKNSLASTPSSSGTRTPSHGAVKSPSSSGTTTLSSSGTSTTSISSLSGGSGPDYSRFGGGFESKGGVWHVKVGGGGNYELDQALRRIVAANLPDSTQSHLASSGDSMNKILELSRSENIVANLREAILGSKKTPSSLRVLIDNLKSSGDIKLENGELIFNHEKLSEVINKFYEHAENIITPDNIDKMGSTAFINNTSQLKWNEIFKQAAEASNWKVSGIDVGNLNQHEAVLVAEQREFFRFVGELDIGKNIGTVSIGGEYSGIVMADGVPIAIVDGHVVRVGHIVIKDGIDLINSKGELIPNAVDKLHELINEVKNSSNTIVNPIELKNTSLFDKFLDNVSKEMFISDPVMSSKIEAINQININDPLSWFYDRLSYLTLIKEKITGLEKAIDSVNYLQYRINDLPGNPKMWANNLFNVKESLMNTASVSSEVLDRYQKFVKGMLDLGCKIEYNLNPLSSMYNLPKEIVLPDGFDKYDKLSDLARLLPSQSEEYKIIDEMISNQGQNISLAA